MPGLCFHVISSNFLHPFSMPATFPLRLLSVDNHQTLSYTDHVISAAFELPSHLVVLGVRCRPQMFLKYPDFTMASPSPFIIDKLVFSIAAQLN